MDREVTDTGVPAAAEFDGRVEHTHAPSFLVIDDDRIQRMVLSKVGSKVGYAVTTAATVEDAVKEIERRKFHCIVLDLLLNGQNGMLMLGEIAKFSSDALLIIISGASAAVREETLRLATHFHLDVVDLPKPVDLVVLRTLLKTHLEIAQPSCL
jgi:DNA-binding NtrC family response regulator